MRLFAVETSDKSFTICLLSSTLGIYFLGFLRSHKQSKHAHYFNMTCFQPCLTCVRKRKSKPNIPFFIFNTPNTKVADAQGIKTCSWLQMFVISLTNRWGWDLWEAEYFQLLGKVAIMSQQSIDWQHRKCYTFKRHFTSPTALHCVALTLQIFIPLIVRCIQCTCCDSCKPMFCSGTCTKILMQAEKMMVTVWPFTGMR